MADLLGNFSVFEQRLRNLVDSHKRMFPGEWMVRACTFETYVLAGSCCLQLVCTSKSSQFHVLMGLKFGLI